MTPEERRKKVVTALLDEWYDIWEREFRVGRHSVSWHEWTCKRCHTVVNSESTHLFGHITWHRELASRTNVL